MLSLARRRTWPVLVYLGLCDALAAAIVGLAAAAAAVARGLYGACAFSLDAARMWHD